MTCFFASKFFIVLLQIVVPSEGTQFPMQPDSFDQTTGIRQRAAYAGTGNEELNAPALEEEDSSDMSPFRAIILVVSFLGVISFCILGSLFGARYAFFGFHGNMEEAAKSCWQTAVLFGVVAVMAVLPSITNALHKWQKLRSIHRKHVLPSVYRR